MRIGITCYPTYGGSGAIAAELGIQLSQRGHQVHFVSYALPFRLPTFQQDIFFHQVETMSYPLFEHAPYTITLAAKMADVAQAEGLDLLHVHYAIPHAVSAFLAREAVGGRLKVLTTLHGTDITLVGIDPSLRSITRLAIDTSDRVTAVSSYLEQRTRETLQPSRPIRVIPNFVDSSRFLPGREERTRNRFAHSGERILLHLSNFRPVKRVTDVIRIFARVRQEIPAKLLMVGDGVERPTAQHLTRELNIEKEVVFLSRQEDIPGLMKVADLFLLPSELESFGLAALEAMSCGVPVIASRVGGLLELIEDGVSGMLYHVGDVEGMAQAALRVLTDDAHHHRVAQAARQRVLDHFDAARIIPEYEALYQEVLACESPPPFRPTSDDR
ncbi:MAG: N-acetyl-alpha-D-glucosaminyl L-malate synthase BshA [Candidatus Methylomirabilales bacterium]